MSDDEIPNFSNEKEELKYWKDTAIQLREKVDDLERELLEFQESSSQLEKELEKSLEHSDRTNRDLKTKCNRLTLELDSYREKYEQQCHQSSKQISELQNEISKYVEKEEKFLKYIRDLEQKNDDLERAERVMLESAGDMEAKLNSAIERNALLENELDEKEMLRTMVQRLKDEHRDMQQELFRQRVQTMPDNNKVIDRFQTPVDVNKLSLDTQAPQTPKKSKSDTILNSVVSAVSYIPNESEDFSESDFHGHRPLSIVKKGIDKKISLKNKRAENYLPGQSKYVKNFKKKNNFIHDINTEFKHAFSFIRFNSQKKNSYQVNNQKNKSTKLNV